LRGFYFSTFKQYPYAAKPLHRRPATGNRSG
jgi:hypothetical protein